MKWNRRNWITLRRFVEVFTVLLISSAGSVFSMTFAKSLKCSAWMSADLCSPSHFLVRILVTIYSAKVDEVQLSSLLSYPFQNTLFLFTVWAAPALLLLGSTEPSVQIWSNSCPASDAYISSFNKYIHSIPPSLRRRRLWMVLSGILQVQDTSPIYLQLSSSLGLGMGTVTTYFLSEVSSTQLRLEREVEKGIPRKSKLKNTHRDPIFAVVRWSPYFLRWNKNIHINPSFAVVQRSFSFLRWSWSPVQVLAGGRCTCPHHLAVQLRDLLPPYLRRKRRGWGCVTLGPIPHLLPWDLYVQQPYSATLTHLDFSPHLSCISFFFYQTCELEPTSFSVFDLLSLATWHTVLKKLSMSFGGMSLIQFVHLPYISINFSFLVSFVSCLSPFRGCPFLPAQRGFPRQCNIWVLK